MWAGAHHLFRWLSEWLQHILCFASQFRYEWRLVIHGHGSHLIFPLLPHNSGSTTPLGTERRQRLGLVVRVRVRVAVGRFCLTKLALRSIKIWIFNGWEFVCVYCVGGSMNPVHGSRAPNGSCTAKQRQAAPRKLVRHHALPCKNLVGRSAMPKMEATDMKIWGCTVPLATILGLSGWLRRWRWSAALTLFCYMWKIAQPCD